MTPSAPRTGQTKARRDCFRHHSWLGPDGRWKLTCHDCKVEIDAECTPFIAEHLTLYWLTRDNTPNNVHPSCTRCAKAKTKIDAGQSAKTKRVIKKNTEPREPSRLPSRPMQSGQKLKGSSAFAGGRKFQSGGKLAKGSKLPSGRKLKGSAPMSGTKASGFKRSMRGVVTKRI